MELGQLKEMLVNENVDFFGLQIDPGAQIVNLLELTAAKTDRELVVFNLAEGVSLEKVKKEVGDHQFVLFNHCHRNLTNFVEIFKYMNRKHASFVNTTLVFRIYKDAQYDSGFSDMVAHLLDKMNIQLFSVEKPHIEEVAYQLGQY
jgi:hypothetical protein